MKSQAPCRPSPELDDMKLKRSEAEIKREIVRYLKAKGYLVFRMQSGAMYGSYKGKNWKISMNPSGTADLLTFKRDLCGTKNYPVWIECKSSSGKLSEEQSTFQRIVKADEHRYILARSVEDVAKVL